MTDAGEDPQRAGSRQWRPAIPVMLALLISAVWANLCHGKTGVAGFFIGGGREHTWAGTGGLFLVMLVVAGLGAGRRWDGVFIDERNRISLSRFQLISWVVLLVSGLFSAGLTNTAPPLNPNGPLAITIPPQIWALLGLGGLSAVAAPGLLKARQRLHGDVELRLSVDDAKWIDLILSDTNPAVVDITKVQQLAFTVLLLAVYAGGLWCDMLGGAMIDKFPPVDTGFVALLTISHATYLGGKLRDIR